MNIANKDHQQRLRLPRKVREDKRVLDVVVSSTACVGGLPPDGVRWVLRGVLTRTFSLANLGQTVFLNTISVGQQIKDCMNGDSKKIWSPF